MVRDSMGEVVFPDKGFADDVGTGEGGGRVVHDVFESQLLIGGPIQEVVGFGVSGEL